MTGQQGNGGRGGGRWGRLSRGVRGPIDLDEKNSRPASAPPSRTARPQEPRSDDQVDEDWLREQAQVWVEAMDEAEEKRRRRVVKQAEEVVSADEVILVPVRREIKDEDSSDQGFRVRRGGAHSSAYRGPLATTTRAAGQDCGQRRSKHRWGAPSPPSTPAPQAPEEVQLRPAVRDPPTPPPPPWRRTSAGADDDTNIAISRRDANVDGNTNIGICARDTEDVRTEAAALPAGRSAAAVVEPLDESKPPLHRKRPAAGAARAARIAALAEDGRALLASAGRRPLATMVRRDLILQDDPAMLPKRRHDISMSLARLLRRSRKAGSTWWTIAEAAATVRAFPTEVAAVVAGDPRSRYDARIAEGTIWIRAPDRTERYSKMTDELSADDPAINEGAERVLSFDEWTHPPEELTPDLASELERPCRKSRSTKTSKTTGASSSCAAATAAPVI